MITAVKTAEDEREATTTATAAAFPGSHGCPMCPAGRGRAGGEAPSGPLYSLLHLRVWPPSESTVDTNKGLD